MKGSNSTFPEAVADWVDSLTRCCSYLTSCYSDSSRRDAATPSFEVVHDQPTWAARAPPVAGERNSFGSRMRTPTSLEKPPARRSFASSLRGFSGRSVFPRKTSSSSSRRLRVSSPTNFRHVYSHSHQFSADAFEYSGPTRRTPPFVPLQVGVERDLSPILPYFDPPQRVVIPPPVARTHALRDDNAFSLQRSRSTLSFHVPRRRAAGSTPPCTPPRGSPLVSRRDDTPPPPVPPKSRARAYTAPGAVDHLKERIAEAMMEKGRLQEMIDDLTERQSVYLGSRPSTSHSVATRVPAVDPLPAIPALPSSAPSFAERLNPDLRRQPQTPTGTSAPTQQAPSEGNASFPELVPRPLQVLPFLGPPTPPRSRGADDGPIQPPPPLVLRPPLRKKKSFSRVSTWLFPGAHQRAMSIDSITNAPRPVRYAEGFYQCAASPPVTAASRRISGDTASSVATWDSEEETVPTTMSAHSPFAGHAAPLYILDGASAFGVTRPKRDVGLAY